MSFLFWRTPGCSQAGTCFRSLVMSLLLVTCIGKGWGPCSKCPNFQLPTDYYSGCLKDWDKYVAGWVGFLLPSLPSFLFPFPPLQENKKRDIVSIIIHWSYSMQGDQYEQDQNLLASLMFYSAKSEGWKCLQSQRLFGAKATGYEWLGINFQILLLFPLWWSGSLLFRSPFPWTPLWSFQVGCEFLLRKGELTQENFWATPGKFYSPLWQPQFVLGAHLML